MVLHNNSLWCYNEIHVFHCDFVVCAISIMVFLMNEIHFIMDTINFHINVISVLFKNSEHQYLVFLKDTKMIRVIK